MKKQTQSIFAALLTAVTCASACDDDSQSRASNEGFDESGTDGDDYSDEATGEEPAPEPEPAPVPSPLDPEGECTLEDALGDLPGDAEILDVHCEESAGGDVECLLDVEIGAFDGTRGVVWFALQDGFGHLTLTFETTQSPVVESIIAPDGSMELVNLLEDHAQLALAFDGVPGDPEVETAAVDIMKLLHSTGETLPQPTKTWCEVACEANAAILCGAAAGGAAACCVGTAGVCCVAGSGIAAAACAAGGKCEEKCDSQNL